MLRRNISLKKWKPVIGYDMLLNSVDKFLRKDLWFTEKQPNGLSIVVSRLRQQDGKLAETIQRVQTGECRAKY